MTENDTPGTLFIDEFFDQQEWWINKDGFQKLSEMTIIHRRKAAGYMLRKASQFALATLADSEKSVSAQDVVARIANPHDWIRTTPLYQAMIANGADPDAYWSE